MLTIRCDTSRKSQKLKREIDKIMNDYLAKENVSGDFLIMIKNAGALLGCVSYVIFLDNKFSNAQQQEIRKLLAPFQ